MSFCENCGKPLGENARFCGSCGEAVPEEQLPAEPVDQPTEPTAWTCSACGGENASDAVYCSQCGVRHLVDQQPGVEADEAQTAELVGASDAPAGEPDAAGTSPGWLSKALHTPWIVALVVVLVVVAVAASALGVMAKRGNDQQVSATFDSQTMAIATSLAAPAGDVRAALPLAVSRCSWKTKLTPAVRSARELQAALAESRAEYAKLESQSDEQAATKVALGKALDELGAYVRAVRSLPDELSQLTSTQAQALHETATKAQDACRQLAAADARLPKLPVNACGALARSARNARVDARLRQFLMRIQNDILNQSQYGRSDIVAAVSGVDGMTLNPDDAATTIESAQSNRQSLLDQLSAMTVPNDQRASKIYDALQDSLQHSIEADRYYAAWMHEVFDYYYAEPEGYLGNVPHDENYDNAVSRSSMAGSAKSRFCRTYNVLAKRFGLRHDWQAEEL